MKVGDAGRLPDAVIDAEIFRLLAMRKEDATVCPSEVARSLDGPEGAWRARMPQIRERAKALAERGCLSVTRGGVPVDATSRGGPIRLGRPVERPATDAITGRGGGDAR